MAKAGSGDVLSGVIGGLMARKVPDYEAAAMGVYLHGLAGQMAARKIGEEGVLARDIANELPRAWKKVTQL